MTRRSPTKGKKAEMIQTPCGHTLRVFNGQRGVVVIKTFMGVELRSYDTHDEAGSHADEISRHFAACGDTESTCYATSATSI